MMKRVLMVSALVLLPAQSWAHIQLDAPTARYPDQKNGPCGRANDARTDNVTVFEPGATITVSWRETIHHPGHYRISFDTDGQDDFYVPAGYDDTITDGSNATILMDAIPDEAGNGNYSVEVTLPDVECDNCTLQLIQMMTDKAPYDVTGYFATGNDLYYQCADIVLAAGGADGGVVDGGAPADAGPADAGLAEPPDGGSAADGGSLVEDGGAVEDAGDGDTDGGGPADAGLADPTDGGSATPADAGADAGLEEPSDAGSSESDAGDGDGDGDTGGDGDGDGDTTGDGDGDGDTAGDGDGDASGDDEGGCSSQAVGTTGAPWSTLGFAAVALVLIRRRKRRS